MSAGVRRTGVGVSSNERFSFGLKLDRGVRMDGVVCIVLCVKIKPFLLAYEERDGKQVSTSQSVGVPRIERGTFRMVPAFWITSVCCSPS